MRTPRVLLVIALVGATVYATGTVTAGAAETPARGAMVSPASGATVEVYSPDGSIRRAPVRPGSVLQRPRVGKSASAGAAVGLSAPLTAAESALGADGTVTALQNTGPSDKRFDFVMVGDGYRAPEQELFHQHAAAVWASITKREPFKSLQTSFNVWLVDVSSVESGADYERPGVLRNTALGAYFWCNNIERLLCANDRKAWEFAQNAPGADQIAILVNTRTFGGSGGPIITLAGGNDWSTEVLIHELGHSMGGLADEYEYTSGSTYTGREPWEPNVSKLNADAMRSIGAKWASFLGQAVPSGAGGGTVGTYEGARYYERGLYRPSRDSIMRNIGREFDPVGLAAMRRAILAKVS